MRLSIGSAAVLAALVVAVTEANAQGAPPLTNYGPEPGFFTPQAPKDLERGILAASRSMTGGAVPLPELRPAAPEAVSAVPVSPPAPPVPVAVAAMPPPAVPAPFVRIPDPTQGHAPAVNSHPLAEAAEARAADTAKAEEQMDRIERENERARQATPPTS
jgi:hypothetical protein